MRKTILSLLMAAAVAVSAQAQSTQELIEAYRNGTLSQSQIEQLKEKEADGVKDVNRTRRSGTEAADKLNQMRMSQTDMMMRGRADMQQLPAGGRFVYMMPDSLGSDSTTMAYILPAEGQNRSRIFGHDMFTNEQLTFEPNLSIATPDNYVLGPGDEVIVDVWGDSQMTVESTISPDGKIFISNVGPVTLAGLSVAEASQRLRSVLSSIYAGLADGSVQMKLSLGSIRSIQVNITGEVTASGTYTLPSLATLFHALHVAGGVNDLGTLRSVKIYRGGKLFSEVDVYDYILNGNSSRDIALRDGDLITVAPYGKLVEITGNVKRPMFYEMKPRETMDKLLEYAGNFTGDAYKKAVRVIRKSGREQQIYNVDDTDYAAFALDDGDEVSVDSVLQRFENRIEVRGAVYRPGLYQLTADVNTVKQLIKKAEGLKGDAFLNRAVVDREHEDLTHEIIQVDVKGIMNGSVADIPLQKNDVLYIPSIHDLQEERTLTIHGEVANPGTYLYSDNMTIEDLVLQAGGLLEAAATTKVEVARRVKNPRSSEFSTTIGETFVFDLKDGLLVGKGSGDFRLAPFDEVYIRKSPAYHPQQNVTVEGEVLFSGSYALSKKNERLSDLIKKAGGITPDAYVRGARLIRKMTEEELRRKDDMLRMARRR